jgi:hypothetical protein
MTVDGQWQPIETRPRDGTFLAALPVYSAHSGKFLHWDMHVLCVEEDGRLAEDYGWELEDYHLWQPVTPPAPPADTVTR